MTPHTKYHAGNCCPPEETGSVDGAPAKLHFLLVPPVPAALRRRWRGLTIVTVISLAATFVSGTYGGPVLLYALFFGMGTHFLSQDETCMPGIDFCSTTLLRTGVALLGARITFDQIVALGAGQISLVIGAVVMTILFGWGLSKCLKRSAAEGVLSGGAVAICGASAALAISAALPQTKDNSRATLLVVVGVTSLSTLAMIAYPLLATILGLDATAAGIFLGGSIHDVAQVAGAGYLISDQVGDTATVVKLFRVACLVPIVLALYLIFRDRSEMTSLNTRRLVPLFLVGFVVVMSANSLHWIPSALADAMNDISRACLVMAISALGIKTSLKSLGTLGWQPVVMLVAETAWLAAFLLVALKFVV